MRLRWTAGPAPERDPLAVEAERAHRGPGRPRRADPDPGEHEFQPRLRRGAEVGGVRPDPRIGMLRSPVVPGGPPPPGHADLAPVYLEQAGDLAIGDDRFKLGARQRRTIQHRRAQWPQRRLLAGDRQVPVRAVLSHRGLPAELTWPGGSLLREGTEDLLDHGRPLAEVTVDDGASEGSRLRSLARAMAGVAYPQRPGRYRITSADEPRLVPARTHLPIMPSPQRPAMMRHRTA